MRKSETMNFSYIAMKSDGKIAFWHVFADSAEEAETTAKWICRLLDAQYRGFLSGGRTCIL